MVRRFILPVLLGFALYLFIQHFGYQDQIPALYTQYLSPLILTISNTRLGRVSELVSQYTQSQNPVGDLETPKSFTRHIVAVGDLHGDFPNALKVLQFSGVVDDYGNWTGNADFFVQTGDIIDRGDDTIKLFTWMDKLREQAAATGGIMLSHLGNHEWMNAIGDWRYVYPTELKTFGTVGARQKMLSTGRIGRSWATNYTVASRLPLHPSLGPPNTPYPPALHFEKDADTSEHEEPLSHSAISFVHGGLSPTYGDLTPFPSRINELGTMLLRKLQRREQPPPHPPNPYPGLPADTTKAEEALYDSNGPLWYRGWALDPEDKVCADVEGVLKKTGTRRMVMGHTPDFQGIVSRCNGKIIIIDTGISHAYGGALSALSIHYTLTPVSGSAAGEQKWIEKEVVSALYADRQELIVVDEREVIGDFGSY
ncbi:serine-threonine protein phosphatase [Moniliophthora roreri MCA 2997]|uniref:Serine-threonine protein phosphatase n=1 Tax=Moniliophthora roreri (strain MCA 2997) TaxID=1381753 RepID=V2X3A6_MONRO|nr:serine-threonine protein phosphatase [Moniliophthora roreri MCA 2997]